MEPKISNRVLDAGLDRLWNGTRGDGTADGRDDKTRRRDVARQLREGCVSEAHFEAVIKALLRSCTFFPSAAEVSSHIESTEVPAPIAAPRTNCPQCGGEGMLHLQVRGDGLFRAITYQAVKICPCRRLG